MIGGFDVDDSTYSTRAAIARSAAHLAIQQIVGLLPERWPRLGGRDFARVGVGREVVRFESRRLVGEADAFVT